MNKDLSLNPVLALTRADVCWHECPECKKDWAHAPVKGRTTANCRFFKRCRKCLLLDRELKHDNPTKS